MHWPLSYRNRCLFTVIVTAAMLSQPRLGLCADPSELNRMATKSPNERSAAGSTLLSRYTEISLEPTEADINPTAVVVTIRFPRSAVTTVGDAVRYLLVRTGYDLLAESEWVPEVASLFHKRLPESQREMGPYRVDTMLKILGGPSYEHAVDHKTRLVSYLPSPLATSPIGASSDLRASSHGVKLSDGTAPSNGSH